MIGVFLFVLFVALAKGCPPPEAIHPCTCVWPRTEDAYVTCVHLDNDHDLVKAASSLTTRSYVYSFQITNSILSFIPHDAFKGVKFVKFELKDSTLMALTDTDVAFVGLENHLEFLVMNNFTLMNGWDWTVFRNLKKLTSLDISFSDLQAIEDLGQINLPKVIDINFSYNMISYIHPHAFASFKGLFSLLLSHNRISEMQRGMLPMPANELVTFDLSHNLIEQFPSDMFHKMPDLKSLLLEQNNLLVLDEKTFGPVWETLEDFSALNNEIRCDCRMSWLLEKRFPKETRATCAQPRDLRDKPIAQLSSKDLWCYK